jgi:hypothetical protein
MDEVMKKINHVTAGVILASTSLYAPVAQADEWSANFAASNNYIWRGLTQTVNSPAVSGGFDVNAGGFYVGTWISNVSYAADDVYSYEHDIYGGYTGEVELWRYGNISYDIGYLYYNYDAEAQFDFGELYGSIGVGPFTFGLNVLTNTEAVESAAYSIHTIEGSAITIEHIKGQDFGIGKTTYLYADYGTTLDNGVDLGFHMGHHQGDFSEAFNGVPGSYMDYAVSVSKDGFTFMVTSTNLDDVGPDALDNDDIKFVIGYGLDIDL